MNLILRIFLLISFCMIKSYAQDVVLESSDIAKPNGGVGTLTISTTTSNTVYKAYNSITLTPGFTAVPGGTFFFHAYIKAPGHCVEPQKILDAGYYNTNEGKICLKFEEKYQDNNNVIIKVYDYARVVKYNSLTATPALASVTGTNYFPIDLVSSNLVEGAFYTLELSTVKGEVYKLRLKYVGAPK